MSAYEIEHMHARAQAFFKIIALLGFIIGSALIPSTSYAVPSFAEQTGQPCTSCHIGGFGPQLTPYGMAFKLGGYTATDGKDGHVPLAAMAVVSWTHTQTNQSADAGPHDGTNNNTSLQQLSGFIAGAITEHVGTFMQTTYSDIDRKVALDNIDMRYARSTELFGEDAIVGISINNNPTVQDVSNSLPAWRFPFMSSQLAPTPAATPLIDGGLAQQVLGASVYGFWDDAIYAEVGGYKTLSKTVLDKVNVNSDNAISGTAPYWRVAYRRSTSEQSYTVGAFGLNAAILPGRSAGPKDKYDDVGIDANYQWLGNREHIVTANAAYIHERQALDASFEVGAAQNQHNYLNRFDLGASYFYQQTYGLSLSYFSISGSRDTGLFTISDPDVGSANGKPDSAGWILQADWTPLGKADSALAPWANVRLGMQYIHYSTFNGAAHDYDGFGRSASDNDTLFLFAWLAI